MLSPRTAVENSIIVKDVKQKYLHPWQGNLTARKYGEEFAEAICLLSAPELMEVSLLERYTKEEVDNQMAAPWNFSGGTLI